MTPAMRIHGKNFASALSAARFFPNLRRDLYRAASPHPGLSIRLFGPGKEMPGKCFLWYVPLGAIVVFAQPDSNLLRSPLVVDFCDDQRALLRKKLVSPEQDFVLTTLHVNLHQLWRRFTGGNKVVEPDRRYVDYFTTPQYGAISVSLHDALRPRGCATTKPNSIDGGTRPYSGVNHSQAILQPIPRTVFL